MVNNLASRITQARKDAGLSKSELARRVGVSNPTVTDWESGKIKELKGQNLSKLAQILNLSPDWLATGKGPRERRPVTGTIGIADERYRPGQINDGHGHYLTNTKMPIRPVPVISWVSAGQWADISDPYAPGVAEEWETTSKKVGEHAFALRVRGDSMEPAIPDGATLIVDPEAEPRHRSIVIVRQNGDSEATCKRLIYEGDRPAYLQPDNTRYPVLQLAPDARIIGVVRQILIDTD